jgi:hypothetical protein
VDRLLAKQPDQRFPDARALLVYLGDRFSAGVARA